ncbi:hypothetical protein MTQ00_08235 [Chryseobacterium sp. B21-037]|uniref:hypothetical protein n=1 Tax=Chryseobacterium sp. B21-037 TaxID=2926038 RepID=UPI002359AAFE|nr:hypothetical protein [Chryseobacterium sp. B21-037]MDC8104525.1 hypothetical protein [Chryseobacterium sp. B21-037]
MIRKLVYSLVFVALSCFSCSKVEQQYKNPIFATFFEELRNSSVNEFCKSYYKDKPAEYLKLYIPILKNLKKYNSEFIITDYDQYKGEKPNIDGATKDVYILENSNIKDKIYVKVENNKVQYLLPIGKGKEDIIGWL